MPNYILPYSESPISLTGSSHSNLLLPTYKITIFWNLSNFGKTVLRKNEHLNPGSALLPKEGSHRDNRCIIKCHQLSIVFRRIWLSRKLLAAESRLLKYWRQLVVLYCFQRELPFKKQGHILTVENDKTDQV